MQSFPISLYQFLACRTNSTFHKVVLKRLFMSWTNLPPPQTPSLENKTAVVVGTVTDDVRIQEVPKLKVCALHVTSNARNRILKAGGKSLTFDQLAMSSPKGRGTILLSGRKFKLARDPHDSRGYKTNSLPLCYIKDFWKTTTTIASSYSQFFFISPHSQFESFYLL
uniref:Large ribosomal subunit protein uL15/eL18 domain-containing protein n=1 Tax=Vombatus ursinus TaxID=29139 RepID=A0A4X2JWV9_VOMUR